MTAKLLGATEAVDKTAYRLMPDERNEYDHLVDAARAHQGTARFDAAWSLGQVLTFEQVVEEAVSLLEAVPHAQGQAISA